VSVDAPFVQGENRRVENEDEDSPDMLMNDSSAREEQCLSTLTKREADVITLLRAEWRIGDWKKSAKFNLTRERVRQIRKGHSAPVAHVVRKP
jgi:DNA-directed RNA polymerase sigma subunit (sigma70/sigma32)